MSVNIAIDGPAGAGKSTIAKKVAAKLNFTYIDTGAMFRGMALYFLRENVSVKDEEAISASCPNINISIKYEDGVQHLILNGEDVSTEIRQEEVGNTASSIATYPVVREKLLSLQREMAATMNVIMDGRDIGTVVLPNADLKIYLTASVDTRAERRYKELVEKGQTPNIDDIKKDIEDRDYRDMHREVAPLTVADDATLVDSSYMNIDEVVDTIISLYKEKC